MDKKDYYKKLGSLISLIIGTTLLIEHLYVWGGFDLGDFPFGHEWYGIGFIIIAIILGLRKGKGEVLNDRS